MDKMIYFDNSSTTQMLEDVSSTYQKVSEIYFGNPSSLHRKGNTSAELLQKSREQIASFLQVNATEIIFTSGGTEGDNWAIKGTAIQKKRYGKHIISTTVEHPAVFESLKQLESLGWEVTYLPVDKSGVISLKDLKEAIREDTVLVSIIAVNNEVGSIQPIKEIGEILEKYPSIHYHVDAVQAIGVVDLQLGAKSRIDIAVFSSHKFRGPRGTGFIYLKEGKELAPLMSGGGQENGLRSGTESLPAIVAMAKAVRIRFDDVEAKKNHLTNLNNELRNYLKKQETVQIFSPKNHAPHILCFGIKGIRGEITLHGFEEEGIYISTTSACSSRALAIESSTLHAMGYDTKVSKTANRVSFSPENTIEEVKEFCKALDSLLERFQVVNG